MRLKYRLEKFQKGLELVFGKMEKQTKAALARLEEPMVFVKGTFETAMRALLTRTMTRNIRQNARRNTRGLPVGVAAYQARAARSLEKDAKRGLHTAGDKRIEIADGILDRLRKTFSARSQYFRPTKQARRVCYLRRHSCAPRTEDRTVTVRSIIRDVLGRRRVSQQVEVKGQIGAAGQIHTRVTRKLKENRKQGRMPYRKPVAASA